MNAVLRKNTISRVSRKQATAIIRTIDTVYGSDVEYLIKPCACCIISQPVHNFYVKKHKQEVHPDNLNLNDFRDDCITCHDNERKLNRQIRGSKKKSKSKIKNSPLMGLEFFYA